MNKLCDHRLTRWYKLFNERWWNGELPHDVDVLYAPVEKCCADVNVLLNDPESFVLRINPAYALDTAMARIQLIHEMVHIEKWPNKRHGIAFKNRIRELVAIGAYDGLL